MSFLIPLFIFAAILSPSARGEEDARKRAEALIAGLGDPEPALCGTRWFCVSRDGEILEAIKIAVEIIKAPPGARYRVTIEQARADSLVPGKVITICHVDGKLSTVSGNEMRGKTSVRTFHKTPDGWVCDFPRSGRRFATYRIHQPHVDYRNDDVIIWADPGRTKRLFLLPPGTKVDVIETVDGAKYGSNHIMYKVRTADGRAGWVPKNWCKQHITEDKGVDLCVLEEVTENYSGLASAFLLMEKVDISRPGSYVFPGIDWPGRVARSEKAHILDRSVIGEVKVTVHESAQYMYAGIELPAVKVDVTSQKAGKASKIIFTMDMNRQVLEFGPEKNPIPFLACDEKDVRDLLGEKKPKAGFTEEDAVALYESAVDAWADAFYQAEDKSQVKGFDKFLDEACRKAGTDNWADYCTQASMAMGAEAWGRFVNRITDIHKKKMEELVKLMNEDAEKEAGEKKE
jgi:hypothetical protein